MYCVRPMRHIPPWGEATPPSNNEPDGPRGRVLPHVAAVARTDLGKRSVELRALGFLDYATGVCTAVACNEPHLEGDLSDPPAFAADPEEACVAVQTYPAVSP